MRNLVTCLLPVTVDIEGRCFQVTVPTARCALTVYAALEAYATGDDEAWAVLEAACRQWLPRRLFDRYFSAMSLKAATVEDLGALLRVGILETERHDADRAAVETAARERSWFAVLADFCDVMNTDPEQALSLPWPLFVALAAEVVRLQARRSVDVLMGYVAARMGGDLLDRLLQQSGMKLPAVTLAGTFEPPEGWEEEQQEKVKAYRQRFFGITLGEA